MRARQHELIGVRASAASLVGGSVVPIFEIVQQPDAKLDSRLNLIADSGLTCSLILNPSVGHFSGPGEWRQLADFLQTSGLIRRHGLTVLSNASADHEAMSAWIEGRRAAGDDFPVDIFHEPDLSVRLSGRTYRSIRYNIATDRTIPAAYGLPLSGLPVVLSVDPFPALPRNKDYLNLGESIFNSQVAGFRSAGYAGLSDFLTLGRSFQVGGGPAYAVAIHLTYQVGSMVRIRHFCSDSNETQDDPGGKFLEALEKLVRFASDSSIRTNRGLAAFVDLHARQHFPGLGKVKEFSIMNHLEVMARAISV
ncbi:sce7725 family protein [Nocardioides zeae]|uniref:Sce7725 family protein n=1 Tax=Nocardioides zeae TaxID=1457234 RepID=A0A6P0HHE2_9ACTN|nr:sce7725 family protein [Nocardioides zeae]NEN78068.1 sce7725 family protein [Nocardioides zeae]